MKRIKKWLSLVLCLSFCLSLMPVFPALAADGPATNYEKFKSLQELETKYSENTYSGMLFQYVSHEEDNTIPEGYVRIDYGFYRVPAADGFDYNLLYKTDDVELATYINGSVAPLTFAAFPPGTLEKPDAAVVPTHYNPNSYSETGKGYESFLNEAYYYENSTAGISSTISIMNQPTASTSTLAIGTSNNTFAGNIQISFTMLQASTLDQSKTYFSIMNENAKIDSQNLNEPIYIASSYFHIKGSVTDDTFIPMSTLTSPNGAAATLTGEADQVATSVALIGFPITEKTYPVEITASTFEGSGAVLTGGTVLLQKQIGEEGSNPVFDQGITYDLGANGKLYNSGTNELAGTNGVLSLSQKATYKWTVTPSIAGLTSNTGTFNVPENGEGNLQVSIFAKQASAGEVSVQVTVLDEQSAGQTGALAQATVSLGGESVVANTEGKASFSLVPAANKTLEIRKDGYITQTLTGLTVDSLGNINGEGIVDNTVTMKQTKYPVAIEAKKDGTALENAVITVDALKNGSVTPYMASQLPLVMTATAGTSSFSLPNGDYTYTITAPGYETVGPVGFMLRGSSVKVGVNAVANQTTDGTLISGGEATAAGGGTAQDVTGGNITSDITGGVTDVSGNNAAPTVISDPLYYVVGKWDSDENPTSMTAEVYVKNLTDVSSGTFGLKYDANIFSTASFAYESSFKNLDEVGAGDMKLSNPVAGEGYHAFVWKPSSESKVTVGDAGAKLGTYTLTLKQGAADKLDTLMHNEALFVMPYSKTANNEKIPTEKYDELLAEYWRDTSYIIGREPDSMLNSSKALDGGFFQVNQMTTVTEGDTQYNELESVDIRSQFVFNSYGNVAVHFLVTDSATVPNPVAGAEVKIFSKGVTDTGATALATATADAYGDAMVALPQNGEFNYSVTADGYLPYPDTGTNTMTADGAPISVALTSQEGHPVVVGTANVILSGTPIAYNGRDYYFTLNTAAGYDWPQGKLPAPDTLTITLEDLNNEINDAEETLTATWDTVKNMYKIAGSSIKGGPLANSDKPEAGKITITTTATPIQNTTAYKITVTNGAGGTVTHTAPQGSTFNPDTATSIVETLPAGGTTSAVYTFAPNEATSDMKEAGKIYVVSQVIVNGTSMALTELQKTEGFDYQFTNVASDQTISVSYGVRDKEGAVTPEEKKATVSLTLGDYGSATVGEDSFDGPNTKSYAVDTSAKNGSLSIKAEAKQTVEQPGGGTKAYILDQVSVDGVVIYAAKPDGVPGGVVTKDGAQWTSGANGENNFGLKDGTIALSGLKTGDAVSVVVTFMPASEKGDGTDTDSITAVVETAVTAGRGSISPAGTQTYTVGETPSYNFSPETEDWLIHKVLVTEPEAEKAADLTDKVADKTITLPALKGGTTSLAAAYTEQRFEVSLTVKFSPEGTDLDIKPTNGPAKVAFIRVAGGEPDTLVFEADPQGAVSSTIKVQVPKGTWKVLVSKRGYLDYLITNFVIDESGVAENTYAKIESEKTTYWFGLKTGAVDPASPKPICLTPGDATWDGELISLKDATLIASGIATKDGDTDPLLVALRRQADVDGNGVLGADDMSYAKLYYGTYFTTKTYAEFQG